MHTFRNAVWWSDRVADEDKAMHAEFPLLLYATHVWFRLRWPRSREGFSTETPAVADEDAYREYCEAVSHAASAKSGHEQALFFFFLHVCALENVVVGEDLRKVEETYWNDMGGFAFRCSMLVDCDCLKPCDWDSIAFATHDFSDATPLSYAGVFLRDADADDGRIHVVGFRHYATEEKRVPLAGLTHCSVVGCGTAFPPPLSTHAANGFTFSRHAGGRRVAS